MFDSGKRKKTPSNLHFNETLTIMLQIQSESFVTWVSNSQVDFCPCNNSNIMKDDFKIYSIWVILNEIMLNVCPKNRCPFIRQKDRGVLKGCFSFMVQ